LVPNKSNFPAGLLVGGTDIINIMEEQKLNESQIINNQIVQKEKIVGKWTLLIPLIQIFGCGFLFMLSLGLCGFPGDSIPATCSLGQVIGWVDTIIFFGLPFLVLILLSLKPIPGYKKTGYPLVAFLVGSIVPLLILGYLFQSKYNFNKAQEQIKEQRQDLTNNSLKMENYSIVTEPATNITNHSAQLNLTIKNSVNNILPGGDIGFYFGASKESMKLVPFPANCFDSKGNFVNGSVANGSCYLDLNVLYGNDSKLLFNLSSDTTYYFTGEINNYNSSNSIKRSDIILSFTTL
jgi:hypothetical protein